jgi:hypothetical protein
MDCSLESRDGIRLKYHDDEPDGRARIRMSRTAQPSPGVALRLRTVIDCTPGEEPVPPVTIEFVNNNLPPAGEAAHQVTAARFMFSCDEYIAFSKQLRAVEGMLAAAGLPRECTSSVNEFCRLSAASAINMYYASVAITVEADAPENVVDDEDEEVVPDGADTGDCAICYSEYVVGGATSVKLPCGHVYHRKCVDKWTRPAPTAARRCRRRTVSGTTTRIITRRTTSTATRHGEGTCLHPLGLVSGEQQGLCRPYSDF